MVERIRTAFKMHNGNKASCLQSCEHPDFHVHDPPPPKAKGEVRLPCRVITDGPLTKAYLHVRNDSKQPIYFALIDHCIYDDSNPSKCDCALIRNENIYFVEFKNQEDKVGATTLNPFASPGDCLNQLAASIRDFYDRGIVKPGQTVYAYASVGYPRHRPQHGAHHQDQLSSLQRKVQEGQPRQLRLRYHTESELHIK